MGQQRGLAEAGVRACPHGWGRGRPQDMRTPPLARMHTLVACPSPSLEILMVSVWAGVRLFLTAPSGLVHMQWGR